MEDQNSRKARFLPVFRVSAENAEISRRKDVKMPRQKKQQLKQRKDGRYCCKYHGIQFMGNTPDEALQAREDYKQLEKQGMYAHENITVREYCAKWLPISRPKVAKPTYIGLQIHLNNLCSVIGDELLREVVPLQIKNVYSTVYLDASESYIRAAKQLFCSLFDSAVSDGLILKNPAREKSAQPHHGETHGHRAITSQEREWINTLCHNHRAFPAVITMLYEGIRPAEAKALNIDHAIDFLNGRVNVSEFAHMDGSNQYRIDKKGKTEKATRSIPLFAPVREALKGKHGLLVTTAHGKQITSTAWKAVYRSYCYEMEKAINGIDKRWYGRTKAHKAILASGGTLPPWISFTVKPYDLRHSFCTMCRDAGVELNTCVKWMGHVDAQMILKIYDEVSDFRDRNEAEKLDKTLLSMQNGMQPDSDQE